VDLGLESFSKLFTRRFGDCLDGLTVLTQHDGLLAVALNKDGLLNADGAVLLVFPLVGFDGGDVRQFLVKAQVELLACDLSCQHPQRNVGGLIFRVEPWTLWHLL